MKNHQRGVTLLELLIAVTMVSVGVVILSLVFPKASATITNNRRRMIAANLAASRIQELKQKPYALISRTPPASFSVANCNCGGDNLSLAAFQVSTYREAGVTYKRNECVTFVNRVGAAWVPSCTTDNGLKYIRIRILWQSGANTYFTDTESMVSR